LRFAAIERLIGRALAGIVCAGTIVPGVVGTFGIVVVSGTTIVSGIIIVIALLVLAIVNADGLPADGDAFLGRTCVEGGTENGNCCCNHQRDQLNDKRLAQPTLRTGTKS
jgi:hypothetical protein